MNYPKTKVYFDGSHYIGIPHTTQSWKKRNHKSTPNETELQVKEMLNQSTNETKKEKTERITNEIKTGSFDE